MRFSQFILAAALALGLGGAATASPLPNASVAIEQPDSVVQFTKWKEKHRWKGNRGRHYGWDRGRHRGWNKHHRRAYYAPPRRHYGHYRGRHYGHYGRPRAVYFRF